jgi:hypothetical protein
MARSDGNRLLRLVKLHAGRARLRACRLRRRIPVVLNRVSTRPTFSSYIWGGRVSPLPFLAFNAIYVGRLLSPLQWVKYWTRRRIAKRPTTNRRPDFPSAFTEWYFLAVFGLALIATLVPIDEIGPAPLGLVIRGIGWLLILESTTWIVYYLLLRAFIETYYTIFHPAEYLLTFPLVITNQLLLLSATTDKPLTDLLEDVVGNPPAGDAFAIAVSLGSLFYFGVAITVVLSSHPGIRTRASQNIVILGSGDVTRNRIVPALIALKYDHDDLLVVTVEDDTQTDDPAQRQLERLVEVITTKPDKVIDRSLTERSPTIIASPTSVHFGQLVELANAQIPFAVEKPIVALRSQREILRRNEGLMRNGFALSYYTLEKSLPLTFLFEPLPLYASYLRGSDPSLTRDSGIADLRAELGTLKSIAVTIREGRERSPSGTSRLWTEIPASLRSFVETTVHPLLVIRRAVGGGDVLWRECALGKYAPREAEIQAALGESVAPTWIVAKGSIGAVQIQLEVGKYVPAEATQRSAVLEFAHGTAVMDFDNRRLEITVDGNPAGWLGIDDDKYGANYAVLMSLFGHFTLNGWGEVRFDDYLAQLDALDDWDDLCDAADAHQVPVHSYEAELPRGPLVGLT